MERRIWPYLFFSTVHHFVAMVSKNGSMGLNYSHFGIGHNPPSYALIAHVRPLKNPSRTMAPFPLGMGRELQIHPSVCLSRSRIDPVALWRPRASSNSDGLEPDEPSAIELPCLPFPSTEVFIPSATTTLHLYEARFLALLEEAMGRRNNFFVHFVLDPVSDSGGSTIASFAARYGCLTLIENVKRLEIGALVTIRGVGRVIVVRLTQTEPYLRGIVVPMQDEIPEDSNSVKTAVEKLKQALGDLQLLQIKLKTSKDEQLQTPLLNSLRWAEKEDSADYNKVFVPGSAERISFAALQPVTGATASELRVLLQERLNAMESTNTMQRLDAATNLVKESRALIAAKLALQSLEL